VLVSAEDIGSSV